MNAGAANIHKSVSKTAIDALIAKHSAVCVSGYPVLPGSPEQDQLFRDLLSSMAQTAVDGTGLRTQTPLVNLGYAMRVAALLRTIESFAAYHRDNRPVQIVLLGAGLDVSGVWSTSLSSVASVLELDTAEICQLKAKSLQHLKAIQITQTDNNPNVGRSEGLVFAAEVSLHDPTQDINSAKYALYEVDLRDANRVQLLLSEQLNGDQPTLIISELVLTYLSDSQADRLLRQLAEVIHKKNDSAVVAWEPLGASRIQHRCGTNPVESVLQGFHRKYFGQFESKLDRGTAAAEREGPPNTASFHPLGCSVSAVEQRLARLGFVQAHACVAGSAVSSLAPLGHSWAARELFDEHAALALHLRSYVFVCAFGGKSSWMIRQFLCPWLTHGCLLSRRVLSLVAGDASVWISPVELQDELLVQDLFADTYKDLVETYRSIRKMVKTALRTDLRSTCRIAPDNIAKGPPLSSIQLYYLSRGGLFLVAVLGNIGDQIGNATRHIVGAIGVRRLGTRELSALSTVVPVDSVPTWEIHRLVVASRWRGHGIGSGLLGRVEELLRGRTVARSGSYQLLAVTPLVQASANTFYASHGFSLRRESVQGELQMRTYCKVVSTNM